MAEQKILISINVNDKASEPLKKLSKDYSKLTEEELKLLKAERQRIIQNRDIVSGIDAEIIATNKKAAANKKARTQAGLNNAILLETGRLASDASYGFTAMANNLSQLTSLFGSFVQTNEGVVASFKQLGKSLIGTGGVLLLVQLFIGALQSERVQEFIRSLMGMSRAAKLVADSFNKANDEFGKQVGFLRTMQTLLNDNNVSQKQRLIILKRISKEHDELNPKLDEEGQLTEESTKQIDLYVEALERKAKSQAILATIQEEYVKLTKLEQSSANDNVTTIDVLRDKFVGLFKGQNALTTSTGLVIKGEENRQESIEETKKTIDELTEKLKELGISDLDSVNNRIKRNRAFRAADLDFEKEIQQSQERVQALSERDEQELIKIKFKGIADRAILKQAEFEQDQKRRLRDFLSRTTDLDKRKEAQDKYDAEIKASKESLDDFLVQNDVEKNAKILELTFEQTRVLKDAFTNRVSELAILSQEERDASILNEGIKAKNILDREIEVRDFQITAIQQRLDTEKLSFEQRQSLQKQQTKLEDKNSRARVKIAEAEAQAKRKSLEVTADALLAFGNLVGKETGAGKALAVAGTLISTYLSAQKAYESQFSPLALVDSPVRGAIAAAAAVASGLQNVKAILSVKTPNDKSSKAAAAAPRTIQAPDFNVVGASQTSQLAEVVSTQQSKPVKAFVVGKDISSQQELDRNITTTASLG